MCRSVRPLPGVRGCPRPTLALRAHGSLSGAAVVAVILVIGVRRSVAAKDGLVHAVSQMLVRLPHRVVVSLGHALPGLLRAFWEGRFHPTRVSVGDQHPPRRVLPQLPSTHAGDHAASTGGSSSSHGVSPMCLLETAGGRCGRFVAFERSRSGSLAKCLPACHAGLASYRRATRPGLRCVVARERNQHPNLKQECPARFFIRTSHGGLPCK